MNNIGNEHGSILIFSLLILLVLSVLGIAANNTTTFELQMATNERDYQGTLFAAEAGINHMRRKLQVDLIGKNQAKIASGAAGDIDFDFALNIPGEYEFENFNFGPYSYRVWVENNEYDVVGTIKVPATSDTDRRVYIISEGKLRDGRDRKGSAVKLEILVESHVDGQGLTGYGAQEGSGAGKNYNSSDLDAMSDFSETSLGSNL